MTAYLYEKDLVGMKYSILISCRHDAMVRAIALDLGVGVQQLRKHLIEHFDMILLENLPARYEAGKKDPDDDDEEAKMLGRALYTKYIPLFSGNEINRALDRIDTWISEGIPADEAVMKGKKFLGTVITG
ncbi:hypothetical protein J2741_001803 [Methanolinea mesophila]|uniref:DUF1959 domain-containing protein n=1 Tax=Methanolinea mesophila TaxID=547055 RepID=UPI001AE5A80A|nr:DUF1959 domain-containing protein [Methanolinea mesophila]MBP1929256.1 hypothetical protein [Methanolinea mesophila]